LNSPEVLGPAERALIEEASAKGCTLETIAGRLGMSRRTLSRRLKDDEAAGEAFARGRAREEEALVGALFAAATDPRHRQQVAAACFLLKARHGYVDLGAPQPAEARVHIELTLPAALSPEQYQRVLEVTPQAALAEGGDAR
jgi:hypothetical protein